MREPIWDGDSIVFAIEDGGNIHLYRVSPDGGEPELVAGGEIVLSGYDARDGADRPHRLDRAEPDRALRRRRSS